MTAKNSKAIRAALVRQCGLEDERREINRELCGVRAEIRNLLGLASPPGARTRKGRRAGKKQGGEPKQANGKRVPMRATIHGETAGRKRKE